MSRNGERRAEILDAAADLFGTYGVRTSLQQVAEACGIQPGSLYHHFESKEAIYVELAARYRAELDEIAEIAVRDADLEPRPPLERIVALGTAIADCAVRHRAALLLTFFEPPAGSSDELVRVAHDATRAVSASMTYTLDAARSSGDLRTDIDTDLLADRICQSMLHVGIGVYHRTHGADRVPVIKCDVLLHGLAVELPLDRELDGSPAMRAADEAIETWQANDLRGTAARIRAAARSEFARCGYEGTTIRDIAAAAGLRAASVYRHIDSKEALFGSIMQAYSDRIGEGWKRIMRSPSTPLEKLDALLWLHVNVTERFAPERKTRLFGFHYAPPKSVNLKLSFLQQLQQLKRVLAEGARIGELRITGASLDMWGRCVIALISTPEGVFQQAGLQGSLRLGRESVLRGAATRTRLADAKHALRSRANAD